MGLLLKILGVILIFILFIGIYPGLYLYSLNTVDAESTKITELRFSDQGITFDGVITLSNSGPVGVEVEEIVYTMTLENTGEKIGEGTIEGRMVPSGGTAALPFSKTFAWQPSFTTLQRLASERRINILVSGDASAKFLGFTFTKPFSFTVDVTREVEAYAQRFMQNPQEALRQFGSAPVQ